MKKILLNIFFILGVSMQSQVSGLLASYYFNSGNANDDIGPYNGTAIGATLTNDRFGNPNHAYYFWGIPNSYINLTTSSVIKQPVESISLWVKTDTVSYAGNGSAYNPILVTKCQAGNNYYEAYSLYYTPSNAEFITIETHPPANERYFFSNPVNFHSWYHVVLAYDNDSIWLYVNATLQQTMYKGFSSVFLTSDSVMLGNGANTQNNRFFHGAIDDIGFYDHVLNQQEIHVLYTAGNPVTGIAENKTSTAFSISPNPGHDKLFISGTNLMSYRLTNLLGEKVDYNIFNSNYNEIDISGLTNGIYYLEISDKENKSAVRKIIKE
jgi:hypothetical protein